EVGPLATVVIPNALANEVTHVALLGDEKGPRASVGLLKDRTPRDRVSMREIAHVGGMHRARHRRHPPKDDLRLARSKPSHAAREVRREDALLLIERHGLETHVAETLGPTRKLGR